eukprot:4277586-Ditylum_brightwellii.AAC.1
MAKIYDNHSALYPCYNNKEESWQHLYQCKINVAKSAKNKALIQFKSDLGRLKTAPLIRKVLVHKLAQWMGTSHDAPQIPADDLGSTLRAATEEQQDLCWDNFFECRTSLLWEDAQQYHIQIFYPNTSETKERWAK